MDTKKPLFMNCWFCKNKFHSSYYIALVSKVFCQTSFSQSIFLLLNDLNIIELLNAINIQVLYL